MQVWRRLIDHLPRLLLGRVDEIDDRDEHDLTKDDLRRRQERVQQRLRTLELDAEVKGRRDGSDGG